ncbi:hypothetical protein [Pontibacillus salicampi]
MKESYKQRSMKQASQDIFGMTYHKTCETDSFYSKITMAESYGVTRDDIETVKQNMKRG